MMLILLVVLCCGLWCWAGFSICQVTHRQRGIGVDPWEQVKVPDDLSGIERVMSHD
jgi:hypothetical protein